MHPLRRLPSRHRVVMGALALSLAVHAAVLVGVRGEPGAADAGPAARYTATLEAAVQAPPPVAAAEPAAAPPRAPRRARAKPRPAPAPEAFEPFTSLAAEADAAPVLAAAEPEPAPAPDTAAQPPAPPVEEPPEALAMAAPVAPPPAPEPQPEAFPVEALPGSISVTYALTSPLADGRAEYHWDREGDAYRITSEAEAVGFFTMFLEGRIRQESRGTVTAAGLRPERFVELKPNAEQEGVEFDWGLRKITFDHKGNRRTEDLKDNSVDWLSMIFQLAHAPPKAESFELRVFTQRRLYRFELKVLGTEVLEIPLGRVPALHLRHVNPQDASEVVDVWLGVEQHYLPVKLRFPVARNRMMVEQVATRVTAR